MRVAGSAALAALVLVAAGCGGSSSSSSMSTADWADGVCTSIVTYRNAITNARTSVTASGISKNSLQSAVDDVTAATKQLGQDIKGLGTPDTDAGKSARQTLDTLTTELQTQVDTVREALSGGTPLLSILSTIQTAFAQAKGDVASATTQLQQLDGGDEIRQAFASSPTCKTVTGS
jgi:hypothetical protein